jgi:hypothetical protein
MKQYEEKRVIMRKSIGICTFICLLFALNGFAGTFVITDTQDSTNWGDWFTDSAPTDYHPYFFSPYFRKNNQDWGWTHTITFKETPVNIISATLEINAWDVDVLSQEVHNIYVDNICIGHLVPNHNESNADGYKADWNVTTLTLSSDALPALIDGEANMWIDIDAGRIVEGDESSAWGVTLGYSTLTIVYESNSSDDPVKPADDPADTTSNPGEPNESDEPSGEPKTYLLTPVDLSLPTINDPGDGIAQIGVEQAWFAFDLSIIPDNEEITAAYFTAEMMDFDGFPTQRTLWYDSDDSWIFNPNMALSDPGNKPADCVVGIGEHESMHYESTTIEITHDWSNDLVDNYITFMLTGPLGGTYSSGAVNLPTAKLEIITGGSGWTDNDSKIINLGPEQLIQVDGIDIAVPGYSVPSLCDWNSDGLQDLIIGEGGSFGDAKVSLYLNVGTKSNHQFSDDYIFYAQVIDTSGLSDLTCPASGCLGCFPRVLYWDSDEMKDLVVGLADGTVKLFQNIWTDSYPVFDVGMFLKAGKSELKSNINVGGRATPCVVDWNSDGMKDLVVGALDGRIHIFVNEGTDTEPDFVYDSLVQEDGADLVVPSGRSSPEVFDLDLDGRKDIITGNTDGQLLFYRNIGTDKEPVFSGYTFIESDNVPIDLPGTPRSRPFIGSWNVDGYPDVLIGAGDGKVHLYLGLSL